MKKLILLLIVLFTAAIFCPAQAAPNSPFKSKASIFTANVLQALYLCEEGRLQMVDSNDQEDTGLAAAKRQQALASYRQGRDIMKPYLNDPDETIRSIAGNVHDGIDVFLQFALRMAEVMDRYVKDPNSVSESEIYEMTKGEEEKEDDAYRLLGRVAAKDLPSVFCAYSNLTAPAGKIQYKISKHERAMLLFRIDLLFEKQLKEYKTDPKHSNDLIAGIAVLKKRLEKE